MKNSSNKKKSFFLLIGVMMMGAVMRVPFTAIPAVLTDIAAGLGVSVSDLGILTSLPLVMFALCSSLAPGWAARLGLEKLLGLALLVMTAGSLLRIVGVAGLFLGTILIGISVAIINVLLPSLVSVHFPLKVGLYTTVYITMMGLAGTVGSMVAVPIVEASSWQTFVILLTLFVGLAALIWLPNWSYNHRFEQASKSTKQGSLLKNKAALIFLLFGGLQSLLFYTEMTWLPTIAQTAGLSKAEGGLSVSSLFPYMMLSFTLKTSDGQATARLSGMVQSGGSLLASVGPVLLGYSFPVFGSWQPLIYTLLVVTLVMIACIHAIEKHDKIL